MSHFKGDKSFLVGNKAGRDFFSFVPPVDDLPIANVTIPLSIDWGSLGCDGIKAKINQLQSFLTTARMTPELLASYQSQIALGQAALDKCEPKSPAPPPKDTGTGTMTTTTTITGTPIITFPPIGGFSGGGFGGGGVKGGGEAPAPKKGFQWWWLVVAGGLYLLFKKK